MFALIDTNLQLHGCLPQLIQTCSYMGCLPQLMQTCSYMGCFTACIPPKRNVKVISSSCKVTLLSVYEWCELNAWWIGVQLCNQHCCDTCHLHVGRKVSFVILYSLITKIYGLVRKSGPYLNYWEGEDIFFYFMPAILNSFLKSSLI